MEIWRINFRIFVSKELKNSMKKKEITNITKGSVLFDEPMSKHTSYGIGGPASAYITPKDKEDLRAILKYAKQKTITFARFAFIQIRVGLESS